jgi:hypothetical protein
MSSLPTSRAVDAVHKRFAQLVALYRELQGDDAKRLYSASIAANQSLHFSLIAPDGLEQAVFDLVDRQTRTFVDALQSGQQLLAQSQHQTRSARSTDEAFLAAIHRNGAVMSLRFAKTALATATLAQSTVEYILAITEITCLGVVALVEASDRHYESEAIKRFRSLVTGLVQDATDPFGFVGNAWECLAAIADVLRARVNDAKSADDVFERERSFQQMTHFAGLQVEQLTLMIRATLDARATDATAQVVSLEQAAAAWKARQEGAIKALGG